MTIVYHNNTADYFVFSETGIYCGFFAEYAKQNSCGNKKCE